MFFISHKSLLIGKGSWYLRRHRRLFMTLKSNTQRAPDPFEIPFNRVIELGIQVEIYLIEPLIAEAFFIAA